MTDQDRGAYTPQTDAPLAFDARQPRGGGGRSPAALLISAVVLLVLVGAIYMFYRGGVRGANEPPQPVGTPVGAIKTPAPAASAPAAETDGLDVYKSAEPTPPAAETPAFAPPPEQPLPRPTARPTLRVERSDIPPVVPADRLAVGPVRPAPVAPAPKPAAPKPAPAKSVDDLLAAAPAPKPAPTPTPSPSAGGAAVVQIGAFSSEALANKGWSDIAGAFSSDMAGKGRRVEAVPGSTLHRSLITGFGSRDAAVAFCVKLKAAGKSCIVK